MSIKEQFIRDLGTDKLLIPSRIKRYTSYAIVGVSGLVALISLLLGAIYLAIIGWMILTLCCIWYGVKAYHYIQHKESE